MPERVHESPNERDRSREKHSNEKNRDHHHKENEQCSDHEEEKHHQDNYVGHYEESEKRNKAPQYVAMNKDDLVELKSFSNPPALVKDILGLAYFCLKGQKVHKQYQEPTWPEI